MSSESELQLLKDAGWSPGSLAAALSPEKENVSQNVPSLSSLPSTDHAKQGASFLSPLRSSKVSKKASESPMQVLARTLGLHSFLRADEQRLIQKIPEQSAAIKSPLICTPQMRYADKKSTPSPSRFIDLTGCDFNVPTPKKQILTSFLSKFQSAKSIYQQEAQCVSPPQTKHIAPALISKNEYQDVEAMLKDARLDDKLPNGWTLFPHQKEAIEQAIKCRRCILAYDMGLGKTIISLKWAEIITRSSAGCLTIVIAPCTLLETWRREALMLGFIIVTENDKISLKKTSPPSLLLVSWNKIPSPSEVLSMIPHSTGGFTLIGDESHAMQNMTSQRTRAALDLCMHSSCIGCILATGTPMKNGRPSNILPLLVAIRHPIAKNRIEFEKRYCNARRTKFCAWDTTGCSHLEELRSKVGVFLMRKTKEECLELPLLGRVKVPVEVSPKDLIEYDNIIKKIKSAGMRKGLQSLYQQRADSENNPLTLLSTLRMLVSKTKVGPCASLIRTMLNEDASPIVIFVNFRESATMLSDILTGQTAPNGSLLRCDFLSGDIVKQKDRQLKVDSFQEGKLDVLVCTFGVGSVGLTLTKSHRVVLMDRPWTPGDLKQAEDRICRIGQLHAEVNSFWIRAYSFDDKLDAVLERKETSSHKVLSKDTRTNWFGVEVGKKEASEDGAKHNVDLWNVYSGDFEEDGGGSGIMRDVLSQLRNIKT